MGFVNFLTYIKHLGEKALVFFPSKTDLISITDKNGEVTEELLSERLDTLLPKDGDASNVTITFKEATEKANIQSGDSLATAFAKLAKFCSDLEDINNNQDRIVKEDFSFKVNNNGALIGERKLGSSVVEGAYSTIGTAKAQMIAVYARDFISNGVNISDKYAPINSPTFTGTPKAPTPVATSNDTSLATTAFVKREIGNIIGDAPETLDTLKEVADAIEAHQDVTDALNAAIGTKADKDRFDQFKNLTNETLNTLSSTKVDKVSGKELSTNDFTTAYKSKLDGISAGAEVNQYAFSGAEIYKNNDIKLALNASGKSSKMPLHLGAGLKVGLYSDQTPNWSIEAEVTGIKGNEESNYRKGNVNITPANIGLGNVNNTADVNKVVKGLKDVTNGTTTTMNYGAAGLTTTSWLAAWNGYELRAISPSNVRNVLKMPFMQKGTVTIAETNFAGECKLYYITDSIGFLSGTFRSISSFYISNRILFKITGLKFKDSRPHYIGSLAGRGFDSNQSLEVKTSFVIEATNKDEGIEIRFLAFDENTDLILLSSVLYTVNCFISDVTWT